MNEALLKGLLDTTVNVVTRHTEELANAINRSLSAKRFDDAKAGLEELEEHSRLLDALRQVLIPVDERNIVAAAGDVYNVILSVLEKDVQGVLAYRRPEQAVPVA